MKLGVIVGRFQVPELHEGHKYLIKQVQEENDEMLIIIGHSWKKDERNLLDPMLVMQSIMSVGSCLLGFVEDVQNNAFWVKTLDEKIDSFILHDNVQVTVYGSRDSFVNIYEKYGGKYESKITEELPEFSGTKEREELLKTYRNSYDYRLGYMKGVQDMLTQLKEEK